MEKCALGEGSASLTRSTVLSLRPMLAEKRRSTVLELSGISLVSSLDDNTRRDEPRASCGSEADELSWLVREHKQRY
jgi:hypothetical protein